MLLVQCPPYLLTMVDNGNYTGRYLIYDSYSVPINRFRVFLESSPAFPGDLVLSASGFKIRRGKGKGTRKKAFCAFLS